MEEEINGEKAGDIKKRKWILRRKEERKNRETGKIWRERKVEDI